MKALHSSGTLLGKVGPLDHYMMYKPQRRPSFDKISCKKLKTYMWVVSPLLSMQSLQYVESGLFPFFPSDFPNSHFDVFMWRQPRNNFRSERSMFLWGISRASIRRFNQESDQSKSPLTRDTMTRDHLPWPQRGSEFTGSWLWNRGTDCAPRS